MTLNLRSASTSVATTKGSALTHAEMDANWLHVLDSSNQSFLQSGSVGTGTAKARTVDGKLAELKTTADFTGAAINLTGVGTDVLNANTTGEANTAVGFNALKANTTGTALTAIGSRALTANTTGNYCTAVGKDALFSNTTGTGNTGIGETALTSNTTGGSNTALGEAALYNNTGDGNCGLGRSSLANNTSGADNTAVGYLAMRLNTTASKNTAVGMQALYTAVGGNGYNVAVGEAALYLSTTGQFNVAVGQGSLPNLTTGANNVVVGAEAGGGITTGSGNTILGKGVTGLAAGLTNNIILADGDGVVKAQHDGTKWTLTGGVGLVSADGVAFPATQVASADANTLDDYEEGDWTPTVGGTATYTQQSGKYTKIGRVVTVTMDLIINLIGTGSTSVISGLPFTCASHSPLAVGYFASLAANVVSLYATVNGGASTIQLRDLAAAGAATTTNAVIGNGTRIMLAGVYFV